MPGFLITNLQTDCFPFAEIQDNCIKETIENQKYTIRRNVIKRFYNDRIFADSEDYIIIVDGVILNIKNLCGCGSGSEWTEFVKKAIEQDERKYFDKFRGSFCGAHYNKREDRWLVYTDIMSTKPVFYYCRDGVFIVSEDYNLIPQIMRDNGIIYSIDEDAIYDELTYGYMIGDRTYIKEIKKVPYGSYIDIFGGEISLHRYYDFYYNNRDISVNEEDIIDRLDELFKEAIKLEFEKEKEYGYSHLVTLSGGCDSRMDAWVGYKMGYTDMCTLCICEADMLDERCAKQVAQALNAEFVLKTLNGGGFLTDFRDMARKINGLVSHTGIGILDSALKIIDKNRYAILHTGELGDVVIGTYYDGITASKDFVIKSDILRDRVKDLYDSESVCPEKFLMINRGFNGCIGTWMPLSHCYESVSPFLYRELFEFCICSVPHNIRKDRKLYDKWVIAKWPTAGNIPLERYYGGKVTDSKIKRYINVVKYYGPLKCMDWALRKVGIRKKRMRFDKSMNPVDKWYADNQPLREELDSYFKASYTRIRRAGVINLTVMDDMEMLYHKGEAADKIKVITALSELDLIV